MPEPAIVELLLVEEERDTREGPTKPAALATALEAEEYKAAAR